MGKAQPMRYPRILATLLLVTLGVVAPGLTLQAAAATSHNPFGSVDVISPDGKYNAMTVQGWLIDPDDADGPNNVALYVDGQGIAWFPTGQPRPDVQNVYPGYGPNNGFYANFPNPPGRGNHQLCAYGINRGEGGNVLLGCTQFTVSLATAPVGSIDIITATAPNTYRVEGWVLEAGDALSPTPFWLLPPGDEFGFHATAVSAGSPRPDVDAAFPGNGTNHGFTTTITYDSVAANSDVLCIGTRIAYTTSFRITPFCKALPTP